jgi:hypothetical protein
LTSGLPARRAPNQVEGVLRSHKLKTADVLQDARTETVATLEGLGIPEELAKVPSAPGSLEESLNALEKDRAFC